MGIKINFFLDPKQQEHVDFHLKQMTERMQALAEQIQNDHPGQIWGYADNTITPLDSADIIRFVTEAGRVIIQTTTARYHTKTRIYQWAQQLSRPFIQISSGEVVNFAFVDHLELVGNGNIKLLFKDQSWSFVSRRHLKSIKEELGI